MLLRARGGHRPLSDLWAIPSGCLEAGLESLLKAAGGNLLILRISHCPNILTDRSLWLASCYCRALQAVTYRWVHPTGSIPKRGPWALLCTPFSPGSQAETQELCSLGEGSRGHRGEWVAPALSFQQERHRSCRP